MSAMIRLFEEWELSPDVAAQLLGISVEECTVAIEGRLFPASEATYRRAVQLAGIYDRLHAVYPENPEYQNGWVTFKNRDFDGKRPLDVMLAEGESGLEKVLRYMRSIANY